MKSLLFITCDRPIGRTQEPVARTLRRPGKGFVCTDPLQRPRDIVWIVACKTKFGARLHHTRQRIKRLHLDKPPFVMALLRPGVGKKKEHPSQRCIRERLDDIARIARVQANSRKDICSPLLGYGIEQHVFLFPLPRADRERGRCRARRARRWGLASRPIHCPLRLASRSARHLPRCALLRGRGKQGGGGSVQFREQLCHARFVRLGTDNADVFMVFGLPEEMLARAEADFEPDIVNITAEVICGADVLPKMYFQSRKQGLDESCLTGGKPGTFAATVQFAAARQVANSIAVLFRRRGQAPARVRLCAPRKNRHPDRARGRNGRTPQFVHK